MRVTYKHFFLIGEKPVTAEQTHTILEKTCHRSAAPYHRMIILNQNHRAHL